MTRFQDRDKAILFRKKGFTYSRIKRRLAVSKSTLSSWLNGLILTPKQLEKLKTNLDAAREVSREKFIITMQQKREAMLRKIYEKEKEELLPLSKRELLIAGLFLYWGEGLKASRSTLSLNNTDPKVIKFYLYWLLNVLEAPREKIRIRLHLYSDMNKETEIRFWCRQLKVPKSYFAKPYIKQSKLSDLTHKGFGHGTCGIAMSNTALRNKIIQAIGAIADFYVGKFSQSCVYGL